MIRNVIFLTLLAEILFLGTCSAVEYKGQNFRDPFGEVDSHGPRVEIQDPQTTPPEQTEPPVVLTGIIWVPGKPRAIINGKRVLTGGMIEGAKVIEIKKNEVRISFNGQEWTLRPERSR